MHHHNLLMRLIWSVILTLCGEEFVTSLSDVSFRPPRRSDAPLIAELLTNSFEAHLQWYEFPEKNIRLKKYLRAIEGRFFDRREGTGHVGVVAETPDGRIIGFAEAGLLPPPVDYVDPDAPGARNYLHNEESAKELPYLANVCVADSFQRRGIGKELVDLICNWSAMQHHSHIFAAVEPENLAAQAMYTSLRFTQIEMRLKKRRLYYSRALLLSSNGAEADCPS